jgi:hypothetical protein
VEAVPARLYSRDLELARLQAARLIGEAVEAKRQLDEDASR